MEGFGKLIATALREESESPCEPEIQKMMQAASSYKQKSPKERLQERVDDYNALSGILNQEDGYNCDICKNKGHIAVVKEGAMEGYYVESQLWCRCNRVRNALRRLNRSGLESVVKRYTFDRYQTLDTWQEIIKQNAMKFCKDDKHNWFFIGGQSGAGKSHICTAITVHYIKQGLDARYMLWQEEIDKLKAVAMDAEQFEPLMKELKEVSVLYIDDLFKEGEGSKVKETQFSQADLKRTFEIINYRSMNPDLITIISSEKTIEAMVEIDQALAGRIAEFANKDGCGYCIALEPDIKKNWRLKGMVTL